ncbi:hypothetical protein EDB81DRAFT_358679 [Dactylonectria macrodidyma]|uniref:Uncharacterized protein n=1 Tax=Dactylonectria macrodidyma TaxID=307937 RepID=A0A9P9D2L9_9HYPO|nr:hypothetical protein EDB81DRAFT_358679 [Dactylonectria macrodidyma]
MTPKAESLSQPRPITDGRTPGNLAVVNPPHPSPIAHKMSLGKAHTPTYRAYVTVEDLVTPLQRALANDDKGTFLAAEHIIYKIVHLKEPSEAEKVFQESQVVLQRTQGVDHPILLWIRQSLGVAFLAQKRMEDGMELLRQTLEITKKHRHHMYPDYIQPGLYLVRAFRQDSQHKEALCEAIRFIKEVDAGFCASKATIRDMLNERAHLFRYFVGNLPASQRDLERALALSIELGSCDITREIKLSLAIVQIYKGETARAQELLQEALKLNLHELSRHQWVVKKWLAFAYFRGGDTATAKKFYREIIEHKNQDAAVRAGAQHGLADIHYHLHNYQKAKPLYEAAVQWRARNYGSTHPDTLSSMKGLGSTLRCLRQFQDAKEWLIAVWVSTESTLGLTDVRIIESKKELAFLRIEELLWRDFRLAARINCPLPLGIRNVIVETEPRLGCLAWLINWHVRRI